MASGPIASWQINGETMESVTDFIFLGPKITVDGECSYEIKMLAGWKKSYGKSRQCVKKQRHHFANKDVYSQSYGFSSNHVQMWELDNKELIFSNCGAGEDSWRVPWTAGKSNQPILQETSPEYSLEWLMLKLKLQYFGYLMWRADSLEKTLMLGKTEDRGEGSNRG